MYVRLCLHFVYSFHQMVFKIVSKSSNRQGVTGKRNVVLVIVVPLVGERG